MSSVETVEPYRETEPTADPPRRANGRAGCLREPVPRVGSDARDSHVGVLPVGSGTRRSVSFGRPSIIFQGMWFAHNWIP